MQNWRDLIRARMGRMTMPRMSQSASPSRDVEMRARNQSIGGRGGSSGRRPVPGLPGVYFADDYGQAMQTAAKSSAQFHSGNINDMLSHPAVGWSKSMAGIDGLAGSEISRITGETEARLAGKGINRDSTGTWRIGGKDLSKSPLTGTPAGSTTPFTPPQTVKPGLGGTIAAGVRAAVSGKPAPQPASGPAIGGGIRSAVQSALDAARVSQVPQTPVGPAATGPGGPSAAASPNFPITTAPAAGPPPANAPAGQRTIGEPPVTSLPTGQQSRMAVDPATGKLANATAGTPVGQVDPATGLRVIQGPQLPTIQGGEPLTPAATGVGQTPTTPGAAPATAPAAAPSAAGPTGTVSGEGLMLPNAQGMQWETLAPYEATIQSEAAKWGVDPRILRSVIALESQGNPDAQNPSSSSHGLLQIQPEWHAEGAAQLGYTLGTPEGDIGYFAALIAGQAPGQNLTGDPLSNAVEIMAGSTAGGSSDYAAAYRNDIEVLMGTQGEATAPVGQQTGTTPTTGQPVMVGTTNSAGQPVQIGTTNAPGTLGDSTSQPRPPAQTGQMDVVPMPSGGIAAAPGTDESYMAQMAGGVMPSISSEYKGGVVGPWYEYQVGHGASADEHAAYDLAYTRGTQLTATDYMTGTVECSGCGSYCTGGVASDGSLYCDGVGVGEIRVTLDPAVQGGNNITLLYGHMLTSSVQPGQQITAGTPIGQTGYAGTGDHLHFEARAYCPGQGFDQDYKYVDPTLVANGYYATHDACAE